MKVLCDCWRKSDTCFACYMANLEDWNQIHAIAMSAEAQRRLEDDLRFLESINVWHLVNLPPTPPPAPSSHHHLYGYADGLDIITPSTEHGSTFSTNPYHNHHYPHHHHPVNATMYLQENRYLPPPSTVAPTVADLNRQNNTSRLSSPGYGTSLPYPDLIIHARELSPPASEYFPPKPSEGSYFEANLTANGKQYDEVKKTPPIIKKNVNSDHCNSIEDHSVGTKSNALSLQDNSRVQHLSWFSKERNDYDADGISSVAENDTIATDGKKAVKFTPDTVFVERDMESPFWKAFTERRRQRRINRQRKQLNAQIANASYQPSLVDIVKSAFAKSSAGKDNNGNCTKRKSIKGEVLVYDNSSQVPETYTAQYVYTPTATTKRPNKFLQMFTCQCYSASPP